MDSKKRKSRHDDDKVKGMCCGLMTGDSLGSPFEFPNKENVYNGKLDKTTDIRTQWQGLRQLSPGQVTDDSEMTLCLLHSLVDNKGSYSESKTTSQYMEWCQSTWASGKNTRAIFKRFKKVDNCLNLIKEKKNESLDKMSQSNGCLMRCSPFALFLDKDVKELEKMVKKDCSLSNPHPLCQEVCFLQVRALQMALQGVEKGVIFEEIKGMAKNKEIIQLLNSITGHKGDIRNVKEKKGWIMHAFWFSMQILKRDFISFSDAMKWIIADHPGSDTDTNASIAGALLGALYGYNALDQQTKENYTQIITQDVTKYLHPRPLKYQPSKMVELSRKLIDLMK